MATSFLFADGVAPSFLEILTKKKELDKCHKARNVVSIVAIQINCHSVLLRKGKKTQGFACNNIHLTCRSYYYNRTAAIRILRK